MLKDLQNQFLGQIIGSPNCDISSLIEEHGAINKEQRIHIYTSAYRIRLKQCIESDHPVLGTYLGDELFDMMVDNYIDTYPSHNTSLRYFAEDLVKLLSERNPFKQHVIIAELASFERHLLSAFDAAEISVSGMDDLALIPVEKWPNLRFKLHPSVMIFTSQYNSIEIWQAIKQDTVVPEAVKLSSHDWLIWRNSERLTEFKSITPFETEVISYMLNGKNFSDICEMLAEYYREDEIEQAILTHLMTLIQTDIIKCEY